MYSELSSLFLKNRRVDNLSICTLDSCPASYANYKKMKQEQDLKEDAKRKPLKALKNWQRGGRSFWFDSVVLGKFGTIVENDL